MTKQANETASIDRTRQAFEMRKAGMHYRDIAAKLGVSVGSVHNWVKEWSEEYTLQTEEHFQSIRSESLARLDTALTAIWPQVRKGDQGAVAAMLKIEAQRAKLLGLDAPTKIDADVKAEVAVTFTMG
jgi:transposase-like protein